LAFHNNHAPTRYSRAGTPAGVTAMDSTDVLVDVIHQGRDVLLVDDQMRSSLSPEGRESPHTMYAALKE
jgi:hypothetical protein